MRISPSPRLAPLPLALVVLAHIGVFAGLLSRRQDAVQLPMSAAMMVEIITSEPGPAQVKEPMPPKRDAVARPERQQATSQAPVMAAQTPITAEAGEASPVAEPAPTVPTAGAPEAAQPTPGVAPAPLPTAPRFDADYLENPNPAYPALSRRLGEQGKVMLRVLVEASGVPSQVDVRASSGFARLDKSAVAAVKRWKFIPARQGHEAVPAWVMVPIVFSLND